MKTRFLAVASALLAMMSMAAVPTAAEAQRAGHTYAGRGYAGTPPPGGPTRSGGAVMNSGGGTYGGYRGYYGGAPAYGGYRGYYRQPYGYGYGYGYRPWAPYWRAGWGWGGGGWGWGGWGWGVGWDPGWYGYGPGYWGWSAGAPVVVAPAVSGAWVLPPSANSVYIERDVETTQPAQQWWYWCASSRAYYPYVESCAENWQRVEPRTPAGAQ